MFWILGADTLARSIPLTSGELARNVSTEAAEELTGLNKLSYILAEQLEHVPWDGFHFYDLIFPMFVFLMGVSTVFSLDRIVAKHGKGRAYRRVIFRAIVLYALGILYHGAIGDPPAFRFMGVLHRIAICYLFGGLLYLNLGYRGLAATAVVLLGGYWATMSFVDVPGHGPANWIEGTNLANYIDSQYLPGYKWDGDWDPEGLLSTIPAIVSGLLGIFAGLLMRREMHGLTRFAALLAIGGLCLAAGYFWHEAPNYFCPIIKKLWTPSFVLYAGGWSFILLAVFHLIIDVMKFDLWARPFVWIGMNPITLYMLRNFVGGYSKLVQRVAPEAWTADYAPASTLAVAIVSLLIPIWIAWLMYRNKFFVRV
jgi:predicted acyltransferase